MFQEADYLGSDDLDAFLEHSREEHEKNSSHHGSQEETTLRYSEQRQLKEKLVHYDARIAQTLRDIEELRVMLDHQKAERDYILEKLNATRHSSTGAGNGNRIDYGTKEFEWTKSLKLKMKSVFGISSFRLCQQGVCNANMDSRDIVCVMPTGGGKSLTYQLPALLQEGCTIVISPLISLITDQILHLQEAGVQAVKLTGTTSKEESSDITRRLTNLANGRVETREDEIKLCYVTPEKIAKSKNFVNLLTKLNEGARLARFVIDEAHCVSQLGHDFRQDYSKLHVLRKLFPRVPIMALSATCPPKVLDDLISTLRLEGVVDGKNASPEGTVYFTAPLYRKNLHYSIVPKPSRGADVLQAMTTYILEHHPNDSGIIYCLSKKDTETVAQGLKDLSEGKIKTGVYHGDRPDHEKETLHHAWRRGTIKVVCATIAFGLGIDKGDVRFVLHHSISKSLEGFYQESGRAGRDGKDSDCVVYYRPQDGTAVSSMVARDKEGTEKLHAMLKFVQDLHECRKTQFAKYFSITTHLELSAWSTSESDVLSRCGHCDNCTRSPDEIVTKDVTLQAWQLVKIAQTVVEDGAKITLNNLATLARGNGGGQYDVGRGKKGKTKEKHKLNLEEVAGGEVNLSKEEIEHLLVDLLVRKYFKEDYLSTVYSTVVYIKCGPLAPSLSRHTRVTLASAPNLKIESIFRVKEKQSKKRKDPPGSKSAGKRKRAGTSSDSEDGMYDDDVADVEATITKAVKSRPPLPGPGAPRGFILSQIDTDDDDSEDENGDWSISFRQKAFPTKKAKVSRNSNGAHDHEVKLGRMITENDTEVLVLSD